MSFECEGEVGKTVELSNHQSGGKTGSHVTDQLT